MAAPGPRSRAESIGSGRVSFTTLDASGSKSGEDDGSSIGDDSGAFDALWRFEEAHHFLLNQQLAVSHAAFVDDLYAAFEMARNAMEQQSVRVLAVLHDKDVRIQALEEVNQKRVETLDVATQITRRAKHKATQSDDKGHDATESDQWKVVWQAKVAEQDEQIEVLLDELERVQRELSEKEEAHENEKTHRDEDPTPGIAVPIVEDKATQTLTESKGADSGETQRCADDARAAVAMLQTQLAIVESQNAELRVALSQRAQPPQPPLLQDHEAASCDTDMDAIEKQLDDAIRTMEMATSQCRVSPLVSAFDASTSCLDMEHQLQVAELERDIVTDELLALRSALAKGATLSLSSTALVRSHRGPNQHSSSSGCCQLICHHRLRQLLQHIRAQRAVPTERDAKTLRRELRHALRDQKSDNAAAIVARVAADWMQWEVAHTKEIETLRRAQADQLEMHKTRMANLVDEIHGLNQRNLDLQTELKVRARQSTALPARDGKLTVAAGSVVDHDHRVLGLEQSLLLKQEQLDVASRAIRALSSSFEPNQHSVRFVDQENPSRAMDDRAELFPAFSLKQQVAELSMELQALKERDFRRFQPANTSQHAVVEYFRLEKECLHLRCRVKERDERIQQLTLQCEQLEQHASRVYTSTESQVALAAIQQLLSKKEAEKMSKASNTHVDRSTIERYYLRHLEKQNTDLWAQVTKTRTHIAHLEKKKEKASSNTQSNDTTEDENAKVVQALARRVEEYHRKASEELHAWQQCWQDKAPAVQTSETVHNADKSTLIMASYGVLLGHYETVCLQTRLLETGGVSHYSRRVDDSSDPPRYWALLERVHALEDRLLEAQSCMQCGHRVVKKPITKTKSMGTMTIAWKEAVDAATQVTSRDQLRRQVSKGVQVDTNISPFRAEESQYDGTEPLQPHTTAPEAAMVDVSDARLHEIQKQLEASLARIDELTAQKDKLKERLDEARRANRLHAKEQESLQSQIAEMSSSKASLADELKQLRQTEPYSAQPSSTIAIKEHETIELVRQLCDAKERCFQLERSRDDTEHRARKLEEAIHSLEADRVEDRNRHLEEYMSKVNQSLASIERDKERLTHENQELRQQLQQIETDVALKEAKGTRSCGTDTDAALELDRLLQLPEHQSLETRVVMLQNELEIERRACDELRATRDADQREKTRMREAEQTTTNAERAGLRKLMNDVSSSHESLQHEFVEFQAAAAEAKEEADKRIQFLSSCVEECSRLVDSAGPDGEIVTARDIYDTLVTLSRKVGVVSVTSTTATPRRNKTSPAAKVPEKKMTAKSTSVLAPGVPHNHEEDLGIQWHSHLQAETWRVRVAKLEASLRAMNLKNKTFEDMAEHLEVQMDALKEEVKDRMTKESTLLTKQGQMKVEITNLKAQNGTLTSRLSEACGELKRTQDTSKATEGEVARLRTALQRKTELLTRQKSKCDDTQKALDHAVKRIAQLEAAEKNAAAVLVKQRDQALQLQELRQQCTVSRDANFELRAQTDKQKELVGELQSRVKALRLDNGLLRDQLRELKKTMRDGAETAFQSRSADTATAAAVVLGDGKAPTHLTPTAAVEMLASQVKTLKKRVLQKQEVILAYKTKLSDLDAELTLQRTKLFDVSQSYRQFQQIQREKEQSIIQGATHLKDELEHALAATTEQLDGLRASIFDACEVFVQCEPPLQKPQPTSPIGSSSSSSWPEDSDEELLQQVEGERGRDREDALLQELRRYADLSPADLADLRITSPRRTSHQQQQKKRLNREDAAHATYRAQQHGTRVLRELEHALEAAPHDCRSEICSVLEFLCASRRGARRSARRY